MTSSPLAVPAEDEVLSPFATQLARAASREPGVRCETSWLAFADLMAERSHPKADAFRRWVTVFRPRIEAELSFKKPITRHNHDINLIGPPPYPPRIPALIRVCLARELFKNLDMKRYPLNAAGAFHEAAQMELALFGVLPVGGLEFETVYPKSDIWTATYHSCLRVRHLIQASVVDTWDLEAQRRHGETPDEWFMEEGINESPYQRRQTIAFDLITDAYVALEEDPELFTTMLGPIVPTEATDSGDAVRAAELIEPPFQIPPAEMWDYGGR